MEPVYCCMARRNTLECLKTTMVTYRQDRKYFVMFDKSPPVGSSKRLESLLLFKPYGECPSMATIRSPGSKVVVAEHCCLAKVVWTFPAYNILDGRLLLLVVSVEAMVSVVLVESCLCICCRDSYGGCAGVVKIHDNPNFLLSCKGSLYSLLLGTLTT